MVIDWTQTRVRLAPGGRVRCEPGWRLAQEWSNRLHDYDLWFVWAGHGVMRTHQGVVNLRPGICIWARPGGLYLAEQDSDDRLGVSFRHFALEHPDGSLRPYDAPIPPLVHDLPDVGYVDGILRRIHELERDRAEGARATATHLLTGLLMDLDARSSRAASGPAGIERAHRERVLRLAQRIDESPNATPPVAELAAAHGYSADHFSRVFKQVLGQSPQDYALRARIDRARQLLLETNLGIGAIAAALGYRDIYFFSKQFKQKAGCTPTAYRKGAR